MARRRRAEEAVGMVSGGRAEEGQTSTTPTPVRPIDDVEQEPRRGPDGQKCA
jgi:hypothetical protein